MRAAYHDGGTRLLAAHRLHRGIGIAHVDDQRLDALTMHVALAGGTLVALVGVALGIEVGQLGLDAVADLDDRELGRRLEDGAVDDVAHAVLELLVDLLAGGGAHEGVDLALRVLGGDAARVLGRDVALVELRVLAGLRIGIALGDELVDVDVARLAVDRDLGAVLELEDVGVALRE